MAKNKLTTCKHCGATIAKSAKTCPSCGGKNKKPFFKKAWFWILILLIGLVAALGGGDSGNSGPEKIGEVNKLSEKPSTGKTEAPKNDNQSTEAQTDEVTTEPQAEAQEVYKVGDILKDGDMHIVYVASGDYKESNQFMQPKDGNKIIFLKFAFENKSDSRDSSISFYSFECYADGYNCEAHYTSDDLSATLSAGRTTTGTICFEVPKDAKEIEVEYESNIFTDEKIKFAFEGNQDSGYEVEKNTTASANAIKVGETFESDTLNISFLKCYKDKSRNQFINPKKGCHYVTCEFEVENVSDSDHNISYFSFDCFADGSSCDAAYFRDDGLSADLSKGRKAKGTVTFEVPDDATIVEFEYEANFWTDERVVFDATVK